MLSQRLQDQKRSSVKEDIKKETMRNHCFFNLFSVWSDKSDKEKALSEEVLAHSAFFSVLLAKDSRKILGMILFLAWFTRKIVGESFYYYLIV